ncbi:MAG: MBL fold metallo-hydrolase [Chloroflexota bacterium]
MKEKRQERAPASNTITFLGTGGARFIMASQLLATGGIWLNLNGTQILLDPGPGSIVQAAKRKLNAEKLSAVILSHRHLDHAGDVNIIIEAMTRSGQHKHGWLFAPGDALGTDSVVFSYLRNYLEGIQPLQAGKSYSIDDVSFSTPVRHTHLVETYGMVFKAGNHTFSYIADTRYFADLTKYYTGELLIMNVTFLEPRFPENSILPIDHLSVPDAERLITAIKPKIAIMTHFGMSMWRAHPWQVAEKMSQQTGIKVVAARDGMVFDLAQLDND